MSLLSAAKQALPASKGIPRNLAKVIHALPVQFSFQQDRLTLDTKQASLSQTAQFQDWHLGLNATGMAALLTWSTPETVLFISAYYEQT